MADREIHVGDKGTVFTINVKDSGTAVDLSPANTTTSRLVLFKDPDGTLYTATTVFVGDSGTGGTLYFTNSAGIFDTAGTWSVQAKIILGTTTSVFYSDVQTFDVYPNLE